MSPRWPKWTGRLGWERKSPEEPSRSPPKEVAREVEGTGWLRPPGGTEAALPRPHLSQLEASSVLDTASALTASRLLSSHLLYWTPLSWSCMLGLGGCSERAEGGRGLHGRRGDGGRRSGLTHCRAQPLIPGNLGHTGFKSQWATQLLDVMAGAAAAALQPQTPCNPSPDDTASENTPRAHRGLPGVRAVNPNLFQPGTMGSGHCSRVCSKLM